MSVGSFLSAKMHLRRGGVKGLSFGGVESGFGAEYDADRFRTIRVSVSRPKEEGGGGWFAKRREKRFVFSSI